MKTFKDNSGRTWTVNINTAAVKRVKDLVDVDLLDVVKPKSGLIDELSDNPVKLVDVLYAVLKPDADAANVSDIDFGSQMGGDSLDGATDAFMESLAGFFRKSQRDILTATLAKVSQGREALTKLTLKRIADISIDEVISKTLGDSSTTLPDKSE